MNKVFYLTSAQDNQSFEEYLKLWKVSPNMSNQNFHNKMIRSIAITHEINVISLRPINSNFKQKTLHKSLKIENNIFWNYVQVSNSKIDKLLNTYRKIRNSVLQKIDNESIIFVDTLNRFLLNAAIKLKKEFKCKIIGICTDNPINISYTKRTAQEELIRKAQNLDGYIALTQKIADFYNPNSKPCLIIDGITEETEDNLKVNIDCDYIFFGGSLMKKYGVYNLIEAFKELNPQDIKLVLCGHHEEPGFIDAINSCIDIEYLGALAYNDINHLEKHALVAVNPRPIDPQIDDYSIPSKTLEYLSNGVLTISVKNKLLEEKYKDGIIWAESGDVKDLRIALEKAINMKKAERIKITQVAKELIKRYTSKEVINKQITKLFL